MYPTDRRQASRHNSVPYARSSQEHIEPLMPRDWSETRDLRNSQQNVQFSQRICPVNDAQRLWPPSLLTHPNIHSERGRQFQSFNRRDRGAPVLISCTQYSRASHYVRPTPNSNQLRATLSPPPAQESQWRTSLDITGNSQQPGNQFSGNSKESSSKFGHQRRNSFDTIGKSQQSGHQFSGNSKEISSKFGHQRRSSFDITGNSQQPSNQFSGNSKELSSKFGNQRRNSFDTIGKSQQSGHQFSGNSKEISSKFGHQNIERYERTGQESQNQDCYNKAGKFDREIRSAHLGKVSNSGKRPNFKAAQDSCDHSKQNPHGPTKGLTSLEKSDTIREKLGQDKCEITNKKFGHTRNESVSTIAKNSERSELRNSVKELGSNKEIVSDYQTRQSAHQKDSAIACSVSTKSVSIADQYRENERIKVDQKSPQKSQPSHAANIKQGQLVEHRESEKDLCEGDKPDATQSISGHSLLAEEIEEGSAETKLSGEDGTCLSQEKSAGTGQSAASNIEHSSEQSSKTASVTESICLNKADTEESSSKASIESNLEQSSKAALVTGSICSGKANRGESSSKASKEDRFEPSSKVATIAGISLAKPRVTEGVTQGKNGVTDNLVSSEESESLSSKTGTGESVDKKCKGCPVKSVRVTSCCRIVNEKSLNNSRDIKPSKESSKDKRSSSKDCKVSTQGKRSVTKSSERKQYYSGETASGEERHKGGTDTTGCIAIDIPSLNRESVEESPDGEESLTGKHPSKPEETPSGTNPSNHSGSPCLLQVSESANKIIKDTMAAMDTEDDDVLFVGETKAPDVLFVSHEPGAKASYNKENNVEPQGVQQNRGETSVESKAADIIVIEEDLETPVLFNKLKEELNVEEFDFLLDLSDDDTRTCVTNNQWNKSPNNCNSSSRSSQGLTNDQGGSNVTIHQSTEVRPSASDTVIICHDSDSEDELGQISSRRSSTKVDYFIDNGLNCEQMSDTEFISLLDENLGEEQPRGRSSESNDTDGCTGGRRPTYNALTIDLVSDGENCSEGHLEARNKNNDQPQQLGRPTSDREAVTDNSALSIDLVAGGESHSGVHLDARNEIINKPRQLGEGTPTLDEAAVSDDYAVSIDLVPSIDQSFPAEPIEEIGEAIEEPERSSAVEHEAVISTCIITSEDDKVHEVHGSDTSNGTDVHQIRPCTENNEVHEVHSPDTGNASDVHQIQPCTENNKVHEVHSSETGNATDMHQIQTCTEKKTEKAVAEQSSGVEVLCVEEPISFCENSLSSSARENSALTVLEDVFQPVDIQDEGNEDMEDIPLGQLTPPNGENSPVHTAVEDSDQHSVAEAVAEKNNMDSMSRSPAIERLRCSCSDEDDPDRECETETNCEERMSSDEEYFVRDKVLDESHRIALVLSDDSSDDDLFRADSFFSNLKTLSVRAAPSTPTKLMTHPEAGTPEGSGDEQNDLSPATPPLVSFTASLRPADHSPMQEQLNLDTLLQDKIQRDKEDKDCRRIEYLEAHIHHGADDSKMEDSDDDVGDCGDFLGKHKINLDKLKIEAHKIMDQHPGEMIFNPELYGQIFNENLTPADCGFVGAQGSTDMWENKINTLPLDVLTELLRLGVFNHSNFSNPSPFYTWLLHFHFHDIYGTKLSSKYMSVHPNDIIIEKAEKLLHDKVADWVPSLKDVCRIFVNYGGSCETICPQFNMDDLRFPHYSSQNMGHNAGGNRCHGFKNMQAVVKVLITTLKRRHSLYSTKDLVDLLMIVIKVSLDRRLYINMLRNDFCTLVSVLVEVIPQNQWQATCHELCSRLPHLCVHHHNLVYVAQMFSHTTRGSTVRRRVSLNALQLLLGLRQTCEGSNTIVKMSEVIHTVGSLVLRNNSDFYRISSQLSLLDMSVGNEGLKSQEKKELMMLKEIVRGLAGDVRESLNVLDRTLIKDQVVRLTSKWQFMLPNMGTIQSTLSEWVQSSEADDTQEFLKIETVGGGDMEDTQSEGEESKDRT